MARIIRRSGAGASGAGGGSSTPASLQIFPIGETARVGALFAATIRAGGGLIPYTFAITVGALPPGLALDAATGVVSGTPTTPGDYAFTARVTDAASTTASAACTISVPNETSGGLIGTADVVTGGEVADSVYQDTNGGLHMVVEVTVSTTAAAYPIRERVWLDFDDGRGWILQGDRSATAASTTWTFGDITQDTGVTIPGDIWVPTDPTKVNWKVAVEANSNADQPSGSAVTADFTVEAARALGVSEITGIQFIPNPVTGDLITYAADSSTYYWIWHELDYFQPSVGLGGNPYFKSSFATVQLGYPAPGTGTVSGGTNLQKTAGSLPFLSTDVGNEIYVSGLLSKIATFIDATHATLTAAVSDGASQLFELWRPAPVDEINANQGQDDVDAIEHGYRGRAFTDGPPASKAGVTQAQIIGKPTWTIPPTLLPDGSANLYTTFRHWVWGVSRLADNEAGGVETVTRQWGWAGGADHFDLHPTMQTAVLDLRNANPATIAGPLYKNVANNLDIRVAADFVVSSVGGFQTLGVGFVNLVKATGFGGLNPDGSSIFAGGGGTGPFTIDRLAVNYLAAGDGLFAGTVTFAYKNGATEGGKVTINSSGMSFADKITSPSSTLTIASGGITIAQGTNNVQVTSLGLVMVAGGVIGLTMTASGVTVSNGSSSVVVDATGVTISNGSSSVAVTSGAVAITNGSATFNTAFGTVVSITSVTNGMECTDGSYSSHFSSTGWNLIGPASSGAACIPGQLTVTSGAASGILSPFGLLVSNLPSSSPGPGSKVFWYDPADGNRVKFAA